MPQNMPGDGLGHFFGAMRVDAFRPADEFKQHMDNWISRFRKAKPAPGHEKVLIPGDPEREMQELRIREGIPVVEAVLDDLQKLSKNLISRCDLSLIYFEPGLRISIELLLRRTLVRLAGKSAKCKGQNHFRDKRIVQDLLYLLYVFNSTSE